MSFTVTTPMHPNHLHTGMVESVNDNALGGPLYRVHIDGSAVRLNLSHEQLRLIVKL